MGVWKNKFAITNHSVFVKVFFGTPVVKKRLQKKKRTQQLWRETSKTFVVVVLKSSLPKTSAQCYKISK